MMLGMTAHTQRRDTTQLELIEAKREAALLVARITAANTRISTLKR
jgi:hypothetical protein